jgi:hypothetical protein
MEKQRIKKTRATVQKQRQENPANKPATTQANTSPIEIPQPFEDTWSPCASSRGSNYSYPQPVYLTAL